MEFQYGGGTFILHGLKQGPQVSRDGGHYFKLPKQEQKGVLFQLMGSHSHSLHLHSQFAHHEDQQVSPLVVDVLQQFANVFTEPQGLPPRRSHDHYIALQQGAQPVSIRPYQKEDIKKIAQDLMHSGVIWHSHSPFSSPVLLVRKADGTWRMCMDYRALNKVTIKDKFPIFVVYELLDEL
jgi:hypothetical protein